MQELIKNWFKRKEKVLDEFLFERIEKFKLFYDMIYGSEISLR